MTRLFVPLLALLLSNGSNWLVGLTLFLPSLLLRPVPRLCPQFLGHCPYGGPFLTHTPWRTLISAPFQSAAASGGAAGPWKAHACARLVSD